MLCVIQFLILSATLVVQNHASPWERNNNIREFDLEWQCEQFCDRLKGTLTFNNSDSECTCTIATKGKLDFSSKHLEHKLSDLGFNFKIIDERKSNKVKRDTPADRIKKIVAERNREAPSENKNEVVASGPNPETEPEEHKDEKVPISERLHKLRAKFLISKNEKDKEIKTAPDNFVVGNPAPEEHKEVIDDKKEEPKLKHTSKPGPKIDIPTETNDNTIVGQAPKQKPPNQQTETIETPSSKLETLRARLAALRNANPNHLPETAQKGQKENTKPILGNRRRLLPLRIRPGILPLGSPQDGVPQTEGEKSVIDKRQELRERLRMRLQKTRNKNVPNDDGDVPETEKS